MIEVEKLGITFRRSRRAVIATAAAMAAVGLYMQWKTYLNHDVAWILYSAGRMLDGAVFGRDIIAVNPPLAWYLALPAAALSKYFHLHLADSFRIFTTALLLTVLAHAYRWCNVSQKWLLRWEGDALVIILAYYFFIGSYRDFGQREHLSLALALPYLLLAATRLEGHPVRPATALIIGLTAGIGFALKPFFLAVPLFVEAAGIFRTRQLRFAVRVDSVSLTVAVAIYVASIPILAPAYVHDVIPLIRDFYWAFDNDAGLVLYAVRFDVIALLVAIYLYFARNQASIHAVLIAASLGYLVAYLVQSKGYTYHSFPLRALVATSIVLHLTKLVPAWRRREFRNVLYVLLPATTAVSLLGTNLYNVVDWYRSYNRDVGAGAAVVRDIIAVVDRHAGNGKFLALSTHPFPAFPTAIYARAGWGSRTNSLILVPAIAKMRATHKPNDSSRLALAERTAREMFRDDLAQSTPDLVLVDANENRHGIGRLSFDILDFYLQDADTRRLWDSLGYVETTPVYGYRVFVHTDREPVK